LVVKGVSQSELDDDDWEEEAQERGVETDKADTPHTHKPSPTHKSTPKLLRRYCTSASKTFPRPGSRPSAARGKPDDWHGKLTSLDMDFHFRPGRGSTPWTSIGMECSIVRTNPRNPLSSSAMMMRAGWISRSLVRWKSISSFCYRDAIRFPSFLVLHTTRQAQTSRPFSCETQDKSPCLT
jgi:hypothetical protein